MCPITSLYAVAKLTGVSHEPVRKILKRTSFFPYKMLIFKELGDDYPDARTHFSKTMIEKLEENSDLLKNIHFTDDCTVFH